LHTVFGEPLPPACPARCHPATSATQSLESRSSLLSLRSLRPQKPAPITWSKRFAGQARRSCARPEFGIDAIWTIESCCQRCLLESQRKAATYRDRRYRQLQNTESGVNHVPAGSAQLAAKARQSRPRHHYPRRQSNLPRRGRFGRGYGQQPDSDVPSETRPGFTIIQRPTPPRPPSWRSRPGLCGAR
jgi:hypothetical protein